MDILMMLLRAIHIGAGAVWVGFALYGVLLLEPALRSLGPDGGRFMRALQGQRMQPIMMTASLLTILVGLLLYARITRFQPAVMLHGYGLWLTIGALATFAAFGYGMAVNRPAAARMAAIGAKLGGSGGAPSAEDAAELARLQGRVRRGLRVMTTLLVIALLAMSVAEYG